MPTKPWLNAVDIAAEREAARNAALPDSVLNPKPQAGSGAYGAVPGPLAYPTTPYAEASRIYPGLTTLTPMAMEEVRSQLAGEFTPAEENALWDISNRFGVQSGMPGAQLWSNRFMGNRIEEGMKRRQQGVSNYQAFLAELSKMGVDPNLAAEIAGRNATMNAAPNPEEAAKALEAAYRNAMVNPAGGTGVFNPNQYGRGFTPPGFSPWPQGGTQTPAYRPPTGGTPSTPTNPNAVPTMSSRTEDDLINEWLDYLDPVAAGLITSGQTPVDDTWFDPGYSNEEVGTQDWWFDPGYDNSGNTIGQYDDTWFDPGYSNEEVGTQDWWFDPGYDNSGNTIGQYDDTWFDPGYSNQEVNPQDWWFDPGYNNAGQNVSNLDDTWFDPGYSNAEVGNDDWWFYE